MSQGVNQKVEIIKKTIKTEIFRTVVNEKCHPKYMHCLFQQFMMLNSLISKLFKLKHTIYSDNQKTFCFV